MRRTLSTGLALALAGLMSVAAPASARTSGVNDPGHPAWTARVVTTFDPGDSGAFAESLAPAGHGALIASLNVWGPLLSGDPDAPDAVWGPSVGQLWLIRHDGTRTQFGKDLDLGVYGMLTGVAVDPYGRAYVAFVSNTPDPLPGVLRVTRAGTVTRVMTLPEGSLPNGLVVHHGKLYVTDSQAGAVWRGTTRHLTTPTRPWFSSPKLAPIDDPNLPPIGANGIAYRDGAMYVTSWAKGLIMRIGISHSGTATGARVLAKDARLVEADGIAFDLLGRAWVTVNAGDGSLVIVSRFGHVRTAKTPAGALDYPTQAVIGCRGTVYVANGSYFNGTPNVVALTRS